MQRLFFGVFDWNYYLLEVFFHFKKYSYFKMNSPDKENFSTFQGNRVTTKHLINLNLLSSLRESLSPVNNSSLSSRMKRRSQVLKTLDFNLEKLVVPVCKNIKADHSISLSPVKISKTGRRQSKVQGILLNNRVISKNIIIDHFPLLNN